MTATRAKTRAERQAELRETRAELHDAVGMNDTLRWREQTATERIEEILYLRGLGRPLLPVPAPCTEGAVLVWLTEIAGKGAGQDADAAWYLLNDKTLKDKLYNEWQRLRLQADRNYCKLAAAAEVEQTGARREWQRKQDIANLKKQIAVKEASLAADKRRLAEMIG